MARKRAVPHPPAAEFPILGNLDGLLSESEQRDLAQAVLGRPMKAVRLRPAAAQGRGESASLPFPTEPIPWFAGGLFCTETHQPGRYLAHAAGDYFVQDAGSMLALALMDAQPHEWIADVCAAPGAKASALLETVGPGGGFLLANEPIRGRLPALAYNLARVGFPRCLLTAVDPERLDAVWIEAFDAVLVDAPCSGQTLVGRGKQSKASFTENQVTHSAARQQRILAAAARLVRPGGRLVYSTCTFATEENEEVIASFLQQHARWEVEAVPHLEVWRSPRAPGGYRLYPHRDRCAGSYAVRLRQIDGSSTSMASVARAATVPLEDLRIAGELVGKISPGSVVRHSTRWEAWPLALSPEIARQAERLGLQGAEVAYQPGKHWMPSHALALRRDADWEPAEMFDLSDAQAQAYLQGHPLPTGPTGWCVAVWRGRPLGWLHGTAARMNNSLPPAARVPFSPEVG
jgi:16S rRNA C967 or C1407 C5-methylase (RsmB/RsmF family)/NOL1/NOP2/fmu family ribosome biogenesis protein